MCCGDASGVAMNPKPNSLPALLAALHCVQLASIGNLHAAKFGPVFVEGRFGYSVLAADIVRSQAALLLLQYSDDLLTREP